MKVTARPVFTALAAAVMLSSPLAAFAQAPRPPAATAATPEWPPAGPTPRAADGKPDLSGNWQPNAIRQNVDLIGSGVEVPLLPAARAVYQNHKENISKDDPEARCLPPGVPRMSTTPYPWTIVQTPKLIVFVY
jgi:hypothetical protein